MSRYTPPRGITLFERTDRDGVWVVGWRSEGKQCRLHFPSRSAAERAARELAETRVKLGKVGMRLHSVSDAVDMQRIREALGRGTIDQLLAAWERHKHEYIGLEERPLGLTVAAYLELRKKETHSADGHAHVKLHLERFIEFFGAERDVGSITRDEVKSWIANLGHVGWSRLAHYKNVRAFYGRCVAEEWVRENPADKISMPRVRVGEVSVISVHDARKLFEANVNHPIVVRLALEAFGGLRASSARRLKFEDIRWEDRGILLPAFRDDELTHKSGRRHYIEGVPENLWAWLLPWRNKPEAWDWEGSQLMHEKSDAVVRAGLKLPRNVLRHSFASYHVALHSDAGKTAVLMQHTNQVMLYKHYKGVASKADAEKFFGILPKKQSTKAPKGKG